MRTQFDKIRCAAADRWVTTGVAARVAGYSKPTIRAAIVRGELRAHRLHGTRGHYRVCLADVERLVGSSGATTRGGAAGSTGAGR